LTVGFAVGVDVGVALGVLDEDGEVDGLDDDVLGDGLVSLAATSEHPTSTNDSTTAPATRPRRRDMIPLSLSTVQSRRTTPLAAVTQRRKR